MKKKLIALLTLLSISMLVGCAPSAVQVVDREFQKSGKVGYTHSQICETGETAVLSQPIQSAAVWYDPATWVEMKKSYFSCVSPSRKVRWMN